MGCGPTTGRGGSYDRRAEPRPSVVGDARPRFSEIARKGAQTSTKLTGVHRAVEISREETGARGRLETCSTRRGARPPRRPRRRDRRSRARPQARALRLARTAAAPPPVNGFDGTLLCWRERSESCSARRTSSAARTLLSSSSRNSSSVSFRRRNHFEMFMGRRIRESMVGLPWPTSRRSLRARTCASSPSAPWSAFRLRWWQRSSSRSSTTSSTGSGTTFPTRSGTPRRPGTWSSGSRSRRRHLSHSSGCSFPATEATARSTGSRWAPRRCLRPGHRPRGPRHAVVRRCARARSAAHRARIRRRACR